MKKLYHNEDCTNFFYTRKILENGAGDEIDSYVDGMAGAGVTDYLINTSARKTNYRSDVWEAFWDGYDPDGPDDQPFLEPVPPEQRESWRNGVNSMLEVHRQGIDYPARVIQRCRHNEMSPWITLRMNDCHCPDNMDHPIHGRFWKENPQFYTDGVPEYFRKCLDYSHREVRENYMSLIRETVERYDIDGLELDFMREPYVFSRGNELQGANILTEWIRGIRCLLEKTTESRGHPVKLGIRIPSRPEVAQSLGFDFRTWIKEDLIDLLVACPRWQTLEFDMPIAEWCDLLSGSGVTLAGGLEILYRPVPDALGFNVSPELAAGAAALVLSEGADAVYLFNYFQPLWGRRVYTKLLNAMSSLDSLLRLPRGVGVTYRDILAPDENYTPVLRARGNDMTLNLKFGPLTENDRFCSLLVGLACSEDGSSPEPEASVNNTSCGAGRDVTPTPHQGARLIEFDVPMDTLRNRTTHEINLSGKDGKSLTVKRLEMSVRPE